MFLNFFLFLSLLGLISCVPLDLGQLNTCVWLSGAAYCGKDKYKSMILGMTDDFWNYASQYTVNGNSKAQLTIYGLTYNILRLANGMGAYYFGA